MNKKPLVLWGGTDINSQLYFELPLPTTDKPDNERDRRECEAIAYAIDEGRPIVGICRGAQLLCALNGGKLDQHNPHHRNNSHHLITKDKVLLQHPAADHHQTMIPAGNFVVIAESISDSIPEVVWWPDTKCLAVQPHPEWMASDHPFNIWLNDLMKSLDIEHTF